MAASPTITTKSPQPLCCGIPPLVGHVHLMGPRPSQRFQVAPLACRIPFPGPRTPPRGQLRKRHLWMAGVRAWDASPRRSGHINLAHAVPRKSVTESMLRVALRVSNVMRLKDMLQQGPTSHPHTTLSVSPLLQLLLGLLDQSPCASAPCGAVPRSYPGLASDLHPVPSVVVPRWTRP